MNDDRAGMAGSTFSDNLYIEIPLIRKRHRRSKSTTLKAYSEVWAILNLLEDSLSSRVPQIVKDFFEDERLKDYIPKIDAGKPLHKQHLQRETFAILSLLHVNYWCDDEAQRKQLLRAMAKNEGRAFQEEDTSWDLRHIFGSNEKDIISTKNDKHTEEQQEGNHVLIQMPLGEICLYTHQRYTVPMNMFIESGDAKTSEESALEFYLRNRRGPFLEIRNLNLPDAFVSNNQMIIMQFPKGEIVPLFGSAIIVDSEGRSLVSFSTPDGWASE